MMTTTDPEPFVMIGRSVVRSALSNGAFRLLALLVDYAGAKDTCWPSSATLCAELGVGRTTLWKWTRELVDLGTIRSEPSPDHRGLSIVIVRERVVKKAVHVGEHLPSEAVRVGEHVHPGEPKVFTHANEGVHPREHRSIYREIDTEKIDGGGVGEPSAAPEPSGPLPAAQGLTPSSDSATLSPQAVTICKVLGLVDTDDQVAAIDRILTERVADLHNGAIDVVAEARKLRERSAAPSINAFRGWLSKAISFAQQRRQASPQAMVPQAIVVRPMSPEITSIEGREARLRRQYPKWSPEADRAWRTKKDKEVGERPPWLQ